MDSAPASVVITNADNSIPTFALKHPGSFTHSSTRVPRPVFAAHAIAGTRSADDTGLRWSKQANKALWIRAQVDQVEPISIDETIPARGGSELN